MNQEEIQKIMKTNNITIPAWVLYTLIQYTEISVKRGGVVAQELTSVGLAYEHGMKYLSNLINMQEPPKKLETIYEEEEPPEEKKKKKKKNSFQ